ncbi:hypothetical protein [Ketobacter sp. GenoA1]|uniref:hypothetical protein n=1 Tax=Ketobacter sp. GenoA1 TaxID=2072747 RepID=UPI000F173F46|nr:hypothetical protein [Ketobacter sp. GenoA1]RLT90783.1 MAG: hypothetical protein D9N13_06060 [Ketobacter sp. GenoA1]
MIGDKSIVAFELGDNVDGSDELFELDIWVLNEHVTCEDNIAYLKSLVHYISYDYGTDRDILKYKKYFKSLSVEDAHRFILSTRDSNSEYYDIENDQIYPNQQYLDWGPNTDNVFCFAIPKDDGVYISLEFMSPASKAGSVKCEPIDFVLFNKILRDFVSYAEQKI